MKRRAVMLLALGLVVGLVPVVVTPTSASAQSAGQCFVRDEFEDINGQNLVGTVPDNGPPWLSGWGLVQANDPSGTASDGWVSAAQSSTVNYALLEMNSGDGSAEAQVKYPGAGAPNSFPASGMRMMGLTFRVQNHTNRMVVGTLRNNGVWNTYLQKIVNGTVTNLVIAAPPAANGVRTLRVEFSGTRVIVFWDGVVSIDWTGTTGLEAAKRHGPFIQDDAANAATDATILRYEASATGCVTETDIPVPDYRCGRTIRNVGGGQYFVDLEAFNMFPANVGVGSGGDFVGYTDSDFNWRSSWGATIGAVQFPAFNGAVVASQEAAKVTVALPPLSEMPAGGWTATFGVIRTILPVGGASASGSWDNLDEFAVHTLDEDGPGGPIQAKPWWVKGIVWEAWTRIPPSWKEGTVLTPTGISYTGNTGDHWMPPGAFLLEPNDAGGGDFVQTAGAGFDVVYGTCTVTINPLAPADGSTGVTGAGDGGVSPTTTTTIPGTTSTTKPNGGENTQGEDGTKNDCSAGFLGRIPLIGGAFDGVARLVCALKQLLLELFVPDDLGELLDVNEFSTKFPGSWVSSGVTGVSSLQSTVQAGVNGSACGPVMNVPAPMSMTVRFPGPAGCGGSGSATADSAAFGLFGYREGFRALLTGMLYLGVVWRLIRLAPWSEGKDDGGPVV